MTDPKLLELNKKVAEQLELPENLTKHVFNYIITDIRNQIITGSTKEILIHNFGTFKIPKNTIERIEERLKRSYEKGKITKSKFEKGLKNLREIKEKYENSK
jgi:nucleoid DNA-binding protein